MAQNFRGDRPSGFPWSSRSPVLAQHGIAATSQPLATQVILDILKNGGNAVDAAIAGNAVLGLVEPTGNGIGGDLMALVWDPVSKHLYGLNGSGRSPKNLSYNRLKESLNGSMYIPDYGPLPISVPGCVDGWFELNKRFGKTTMEKLLQPAIQYARNGFPVTQIIASAWKNNVNNYLKNKDLLPEFENFEEIFMPNGAAPVEGQIFRNPYLANTLETISTQGQTAFYNGPITDTLISFFGRTGCFLTKEDFSTHHSTWEEPLSTSYRGYTLHELHPNTQGLAALQILNILENFDLKSMGYNSSEFIHTCVEAKKLAFADRAKFYADPAFGKVPVDGLNSKEYARERAKLIDPKRAMDRVDAGNPNLNFGDTIYMTVADKDGMMVSLIQSNYMGMGSGMAPPGLGFVLQNRGQMFSMHEGSANIYAPGKRPFQTIIPGFITKDGSPYMSFGVMGGAMQPQGHAQIVINMIDFGMDVQAAGDATRWFHYNDNEPTGEIMTTGGLLALESGIDPTVLADLVNLGHKLQYAPGQFGGYQAIMWDMNNKVYHAASEMRKDGQAAGY